MKIGEVVKKLLGDREQKELIEFVTGEYTNAIGTNFSRWLSGKGEYPTRYLLKTAEYLKISIFDLLGYEDFTNKELDDLEEKMQDFENPLKEEMQELPFYIKDSFPVVADDEAMSPYIATGDCCIFQSASLKEVEEGEIVFFNYEDKEGIRILKVRPNGKYLLKALNGLYDDIDATNKRKLKVHKLFKIIREPKKF